MIRKKIMFVHTIYPQCPHCGRINHATDISEVISGAIGFCDTCGELALIIEQGKYFICHQMTNEMIELFKGEFPEQYEVWVNAKMKIKEALGSEKNQPDDIGKPDDNLN